MKGVLEALMLLVHVTSELGDVCVELDSVFVLVLVHFYFSHVRLLEELGVGFHDHALSVASLRFGVRKKFWVLRRGSKF